MLPDDDNDGYTSDVDCNDNDAAINPGATEVCDGVDNDCDGTIDNIDTTCPAELDAYWTFDSDFTDSQGIYNGTSIGVTIAAGHIDGYAVFNDASYIDMGNINLLEGKTDATIATWVYLNAMPTNGNCNGGPCDIIVFNFDYSYYFGILANGKLETSWSSTGSSWGSIIRTESSGVLTSGSWYHVAVVKQGTSIKYYINGVLDTTASDEAVTIASTGSFNVGRIQAGSSYLNGRLDELAIYSKALTDQEISGLYSSNDHYCGEPIICCTDVDGDGYGVSGGSGCTYPGEIDCDDSDANINPATIWYADNDNDGYGDSNVTLTQCLQPTGYVLNNTDCDDNDANINPATIWYADADSDGYGDTNVSLTQCLQPTGYVLDNTDCDDNEANAYPGNTEVCDGIDNNCDGQIDEGVLTTFYADSDGDGFGDPNVTTQDCSAPTGFVADNTDCDDNEANAYPGNTEVCDGIDNNCNGIIDEGCGDITAVEYFVDNDPGVGNGLSLPVTSGSNIIETFNIPTTGLSLGLHVLHIRTQDGFGTWSLFKRRYFYIQNPYTPPTPTTITAAEYFIDNDPGVGGGLPLTITYGNTIDETFALPTSTLSNGLHVLHIRARDGFGRWSLFKRRYFYIQPPYTPPTPTTITAAEYFIDNDPGVGSGFPLTITSGNTIDETFTIPTSLLSNGLHVLHIRARDGFGKWSLFKRRYFYIQDPFTPPAPTIITTAEYFIDNDPGFGNGTDVPITPGVTIDETLMIPVACLDPGDYVLHIRVKNENEVWSFNIFDQFTVEEDTTLPTAICQDKTVQLDATGNASIISSDIDNGSNYACGIASLVLDKTDFNCDDIGSNTVTLTVTDNNNNVSTCTAIVTVIDDIDPVVSCPADITVSNNTGDCGALVSFSPSFTDNCNGGSISASPASGSLFAVGTTVVTVTATDAAGNTDVCSFNITVNDTEDPSITCPSNISLNATSASGALVTYTMPVGTDNCTGSTTTLIAGFASGDTFPIGVTTVTYQVTDADNLTSQCSFTVTVTGLPPVINCPSNIIVNNTIGQCGTNVNFAATETTSIPVSTITYSHQSGDFFQVGTTTVTATATNAVGTSSCSFDVTVNDTDDPVITCPSNIGLNATSASGAIVTYSTPEGTDNCSGATTALTAGFASGGTFPIGVTTVTYQVTDANNLTSQCSFTVTVTGLAPVINCPANIIVNNTIGQCGTNVNFAATETIAIPASTITYSHQSGDFFQVGTTTVTATATNAVGTSSCLFDVTVENEVPKITSLILPIDPNDISQQIFGSATFFDDNLDSATWDWGDTASSPGFINGNSITGNHFYANAGVYEVSLILIDVCGEETTALFQYIVIYDPNGGFVTGGGWINSPQGAYVPVPNLIGKANFGFVSKYKKGQSIPDGNTEFQFHAGNLNFKSTVYDWLIVAGTKAMFKGYGTVNGQGNYQFMLSAKDENKAGGDDTFRIKIWDSSTEIVVYDNQLGDDDNADATTVIGGGSIIVHKGNGNFRTVNIVDYKDEIIFWPNPSDSSFNIKLISNNSLDKVDIYVYDVTNKLVHHNQFEPDQEYRFGKELAGGVYIVKIIQAGKTQSVRLIKF